MMAAIEINVGESYNYDYVNEQTGAEVTVIIEFEHDPDGGMLEQGVYGSFGDRIEEYSLHIPSGILLGENVNMTAQFKEEPSDSAIEQWAKSNNIFTEDDSFDYEVNEVEVEDSYDEATDTVEIVYELECDGYKILARGMKSRYSTDSTYYYPSFNYPNPNGEVGLETWINYIQADFKKFISYGEAWNYVYCNVTILDNDNVVIGESTVGGVESDSNKQYVDQIVSEELGNAWSEAQSISPDIGDQPTLEELELEAS